MEWRRGRIIGRGSTATVSLATSSVSGEVFAVKSTEVSSSEFLQREQRIMSSLSSPYLVGYKGYGVSKECCDVFYNIFLEYLPGGTLSDVIHRNGGRLDEPTIRSFTSQILLGLDYLHSNGLVHCDIKSRNVLIGEEGAKISDFGCAKWLDSEEFTPGAVAGTPLFMAPEVARGEEQRFASDIWSLGCTIIEMATGEAPWRDLANPVSVLYRVGHSNQVPELPRFLSPQAKDFLERCLRRDPSERWTARQLLCHPFLQRERKQSEQILLCNPSSSPTSILDHDFWNEPETSAADETMMNIPARIELGSLATSSVGDCSSWDHDEDWITVRERNHEAEKVPMSSPDTTAVAGSCGEVLFKIKKFQTLFELLYIS